MEQNTVDSDGVCSNVCIDLVVLTSRYLCAGNKVVLFSDSVSHGFFLEQSSESFAEKRRNPSHFFFLTSETPGLRRAIRS